MTTFDPGARLALTHGLVRSPRSTAFLASRPAATITDGFDVLVQLVIAAITTEPLVIGADARRGLVRDLVVGPDRRTAALGSESLDDRQRGRRRFLGRRGGDQLLEGRPERRFGVVQRNPILRAPRAGQAGLDGRKVELERVGVFGLGRVCRGKHPLGLGVRLDQADQVRRAPRQLEIADRLGVDRKQPAGGAIFGRHVGERGPVGQRQPGEPRSKVFDELADDSLLPEHLGGREDQVGGRRPFLEFAA